MARLIQDSERHAIVERATSTWAVMNNLTDQWSWEVISPGAFLAKIDAVTTDGLTMRLVEAESEERSGQGGRERAVEAVHAATVRALEVARVAWAEVPDRLVAVAPLRAGGQVMGVIMDEGEEWAAVWEEIEPGWVPVAGLTLAVFQGLLAAVPVALREERRMRVRRRRTGAALAVALAELWELSRRWYQMATAVLDAETADLLRQIPTTHVPRYAEAAKKRRAAKRAAAAAAQNPAV